MNVNEIIARLGPKIGKHYATSARMTGQTHQACMSALLLATTGKGVLYLHDNKWTHPRYVMGKILDESDIGFTVTTPDRAIMLKQGSGVIYFRRLDKMDHNQLEKCFGFARGTIIIDDDSLKRGPGR